MSDVERAVVDLAMSILLSHTDEIPDTLESELYEFRRHMVHKPHGPSFIPHE